MSFCFFSILGSAACEVPASAQISAAARRLCSFVLMPAPGVRTKVMQLQIRPQRGVARSTTAKNETKTNCEVFRKGDLPTSLSNRSLITYPPERHDPLRLSAWLPLLPSLPQCDPIGASLRQG